MARIRTIKPEFWRDEDLSSVSPEAALLAIGLLNHADDEGYFNANAKLIESDVFPLRELSGSVTGMLKELCGIGYLQLFSGSDGKHYGLVVNFVKHQVINKPSPSKIKGLCKIPEECSSPTVALPVGKERKGKEQGTGKGKEQGDTRAARDVFDEQAFDRFWEAYDYRVGKQHAVKVWKAIKPDTDLVEQIIEAANRYSRSNPEKVYYKHASTWLNGKHWEDDPRTLKPKIAQQNSQPSKTQHQLNNEAFARSIGLDKMYGKPAQTFIDIEGDIHEANQTTPRQLGR